ncbi:PREDICTED: uncharacterized protein LOC106749054, partial [Dinoponera quadriceps]|uniref:Uncharacterized protein LOC106749054 n=1 Tax=Dinoponera quadriceps TaxID=609295 RepID=A0A6P3XYF8_DINQU
TTSQVLPATLLEGFLVSMYSFGAVMEFYMLCFCVQQLEDAVPKANLVEGFSMIMFTLGGVLQFYILCSSVQQLLDASTGMTDVAFHENWYQFGSPIKRTFILMILSNNLKCKLTTCEKLNLSLPSFMT